MNGECADPCSNTSTETTSSAMKMIAVGTPAELQVFAGAAGNAMHSKCIGCAASVSVSFESDCTPPRQIRSKAMSVTVRQMRPDELPEIFRLYGEAFGPESLAAFRQRFDWEFVQNPRCDGEMAPMWVAVDEDGSLIGYIGSFPMLLKVGDRSLLTSSSGDLLVTAAARGKGVGGLVSKAYRDGAGELATDGFGYQPVTGRIYKRLGYQEVECMPVYMRPMQIGALYRFALGSGRAPRVFSWPGVAGLGAAGSALAQVAVSGMNRLRMPPRGSLNVTTARDIGEEYDELWQRVSPEFPLAFVRDSAWIRWRFVDDPVATHTVLEARDATGTLAGYLVYSISEKSNMRVMRVMDLFCSLERTDVVDALAAQLLEDASREGVAAISCWGLHPSLRKRMRRYLYFTPPSEQQATLLYCTGDEATQALVYDGAQWHATRGDGDEGLAP